MDEIECEYIFSLICTRTTIVRLIFFVLILSARDQPRLHSSRKKVSTREHRDFSLFAFLLNLATPSQWRHQLEEENGSL